MNHAKTKHALPMLLLAGVLLFSTTASATGPRITKSLFSITKSEIHALDFPPFLSSEVPDDGPFSEIVNTLLREADIDAVISTHPLYSMVRYYLLEENALAVMGRHLDLTAAERKQLIFIPLAVLAERYYYYAPAYPKGLDWKGNLASLKGKTYAAHRGEDVAAYSKAGLAVRYDRTIGLLKMIAAGKADFASIPPLTADWLLDKYMPTEKGHFATMPTPAGKEVYYIVFNRKHAQGADAAARFRKALSKMISDGRYADIMRRFLGDDEALKRSMGDLKALVGE